MKLKIKDSTEIELQNKLSIYFDDVNHNIVLKQFNNKNIYGTNFGYGEFFSGNSEKTNIYTITSDIYETRQVTGYFGDIFHFQKEQNFEHNELVRYLFSNSIANNHTEMWATFFNAAIRHTPEAFLFFEPLEKLSNFEKIIWLKMISFLQVTKKVPVIIFTQDIASVKLSGIEFEMFDPNGETTKFFELTNAIQKSEKETISKIIDNYFTRFQEKPKKRSKKNVIKR